MEKHDELDFPILVAIATARGGQCHGYRLHHAMRERLKLDVPIASIYRVIKRLTSRGFVESRRADHDESLAGTARKVCWLTDAGRDELRHLADLHRERAGRISAVLKYFDENCHDHHTHPIGRPASAVPAHDAGLALGGPAGA